MYVCILVNMLHDRVFETEARSRGERGVIPDSLRNTGEGVKLKCYVS